MKLCEMDSREIENQYSAMINEAGYSGTISMINGLNLWDEDESIIVQICQESGGGQ